MQFTGENFLLKTRERKKSLKKILVLFRVRHVKNIHREIIDYSLFWTFEHAIEGVNPWEFIPLL